MSRSLIASFENQFQASSAADKLFSIGLPRDALLLHLDERGMQPASSSFAPTTVVRESESSARTDDHAVRDDKAQVAGRPHGDKTSTRLPTQALRGPAVIGHARITVRLPCPIPEDALTRTLAAAGAVEVLHSDDEAPVPNPAMSPVIDIASGTDVERAIAASRGGDTIGQPRD